jgi:HTH-type transcriptional regulator/antitoxin HigA
MTKPIQSKKEYHETMVRIYTLMNKGEEKYENDVLGLEPKKIAQSITELVEYKMFERKMNQASLANRLGMSQSKVSDILNGKRKADILFLKGVHQLFQLDAEFLLKHA